MKYFRIAVISLFFLILTASTACSFSSSQAQAEQQVTVTRGDLAIKVNGSGKAGYAKDARLSFGTAGKIEKVNVKKGDMVDKGSVLAILNTDALELTLSQAQTDEAKAQLISIQSRTALVQAEIGEAEASHALTAAQFNLDKIEDVGKIKDKIMDLEWQLKIAETNRSQAQAAGNTSTVKALNDIIRDTNSELDRQNQKLQDLLSQDEYAGVAPYEVKSLIIGGERYDRLLVEDIRMKQQQVLLSEKAVEQARQNIELAKQSVVQAERSVEQAQKHIKYTQLQLQEASILAPFNGLVADVGVKEGDYVTTSGANSDVPVYLVDPGSLEIAAEVDEIDMAVIKLNQKSAINLDAFPDKEFEGIVTAISVIPVVKTQNSGVVVYEVKVGFTGNPPAEVKSGMSAVVDIISQEKKNIVLLPNKSIKRNNQGQTIVNVLINQKFEERPVVLGITDGSQTEVISGLNEGEMVSRTVKEVNPKLTKV